jgi:hypothetical protein
MREDLRGYHFTLRDFFCDVFQFRFIPGSSRH